MEDGIESVERLHAESDEDLHFRFIGAAKRRPFVVNVQFASTDENATESLRPEEYDFMIGKVLGLIVARLNETSNPALN